MDNQIPQPPTQNNPEPVPQPPTQSNTEQLTQTSTLNTPQITNIPTEPHHTLRVTIALLFLFFGPLASFIIWKGQRYRRWFAIMLIFFGSVLALLFLVTGLIRILASLNATYKLRLPIEALIIPLIFELILSTSQLLLGIYSYRKAKTSYYAPIWLLILTAIFLNLDLIIILWLVAGIPISKITS